MNTFTDCCNSGTLPAIGNSPGVYRNTLLKRFTIVQQKIMSTMPSTLPSQQALPVSKPWREDFRTPSRQFVLTNILRCPSTVVKNLHPPDSLSHMLRKQTDTGHSLFQFYSCLNSNAASFHFEENSSDSHKSQEQIGRLGVTNFFSKGQLTYYRDCVSLDWLVCYTYFVYESNIHCLLHEVVIEQVSEHYRTTRTYTL